MAVIDPTWQVPAAGCRVYQWATLLADDTGEPVRLVYYQDKSVQLGTVGGNTDGGATIVLQGSNDPLADPAAVGHTNAVWFTLTDPQGNAISRTTSAKIEEVTENPLWVRPVVTGGDETTDIDVVLTCKGGV